VCQESSTAVLDGWEDVDAGASVDAVVAWAMAALMEWNCGWAGTGHGV
jgi:hypothetical protein